MLIGHRTGDYILLIFRSWRDFDLPKPRVSEHKPTYVTQPCITTTNILITAQSSGEHSDATNTAR